MQPLALSHDLSPIFRSDTQFRLLGELFVRPDRQFSLSELAALVGSSPSAVSREVDRLSSIGIVAETRQGNQRLIAARLESPIAAELESLLLKSYGPARVLGELLAGVAGLEEAMIFGSWAARAAGEPGPTPRDVDLLVIGLVDPLDVYELARVAAKRLGVEVNPVVRTRQEWDEDRTEFASAVRRGALLGLLSEERDD